MARRVTRKCQARYPTPFWREEGLTGQATSNTGPVKVTFDNSPADGTPGVMLGFIEGTDGRVKSWAADPWARGCYTGYTAPGVLLDYGTALREPIGRIHWAGTETATRWSGYIDGAVQSGERAAAEVLEALR